MNSLGFAKKNPKVGGVWGSGNEQKANLAVQKQMQLLLVAKAKKRQNAQNKQLQSTENMRKRQNLGQVGTFAKR